MFEKGPVTLKNAALTSEDLLLLIVASTQADLSPGVLCKGILDITLK